MCETKPCARRVYMEPRLLLLLLLPSAQEESRARSDRSNHVIDLPMLYYTAQYGYKPPAVFNETLYVMKESG